MAEEPSKGQQQAYGTGMEGNLFQKVLYKVLPPGHNNPMHPHSFGAEQLQGISVGRDGGRIIESFILEKTSKIF